MGWCDIICKNIEDITEQEFLEQCVDEDFCNCDLCYHHSNVYNEIIEHEKFLMSRKNHSNYPDFSGNVFSP